MVDFISADFVLEVLLSVQLRGRLVRLRLSAGGNFLLDGFKGLLALDFNSAGGFGGVLNHVNAFDLRRTSLVTALDGGADIAAAVGARGEDRRLVVVHFNRFELFFRVDGLKVVQSGHHSTLDSLERLPAAYVSPTLGAVVPRLRDAREHGLLLSMVNLWLGFRFSGHNLRGRVLLLH